MSVGVYLGKDVFIDVYGWDCMFIGEDGCMLDDGFTDEGLWLYGWRLDTYVRTFEKVGEDGFMSG